MPKPKLKPRQQNLQHVQRIAGVTDDYHQAQASTLLPQTTVDAELVHGDPDKGRRFRQAGGAGLVTRKPHLDALLGVSYVTLWEEMRRLSEDAKSRKLTNDEMKRYATLVDSLAKLARTEKDAVPKDDPDEMSREEMLAAAEEAMKLLKGSK